MNIFEEMTLNTGNFVHSDKEQVIFEIEIEKKYIDDTGFIDKGHLISLIDSFSSKSAFFFNQDLLFHLSVNLRCNFLKQTPIKNNKIQIITQLKHNKNFIFMEISVMNEGNLIVQASHLKRRIKFKF